MTMNPHALYTLESLPSEILIQILFSVDHVRTLHNLVRASPRTACQLAVVGPEALDNAITASMAPQVESVMRLVALVRTCTKERPPAASLEAFTAQYTAPTNPASQALEQAPVPPLASIYQQSSSSSSCSELLARSHQVAQVTASFLAYCRGRCLACKPHHIANPSDSMRI